MPGQVIRALELREFDFLSLGTSDAVTVVVAEHVDVSQ